MAVTHRFFFTAGTLLATASGLPLFSQTVPEEDELPPALHDRGFVLPDHMFEAPRLNVFSVSMRYIGEARTKFSNLGTITTNFDNDDTTSLINRVYIDGYVAIDQRGANSSSPNFSDGRTNVWSYDSPEQISEDGDSIEFHSYAASPGDAEVFADSRRSVNPDIEYSRMLMQTGPWLNLQRRKLQFGLLAGWGLTDINSKFRGTTLANLEVLTDKYSLLGAPAPFEFDDDGNQIGYTAPSTETITITDPDGTTSTYIVDTTTLLESLPFERTFETRENQATIQGFWQVHGAYFTMRTGPWMRWEPKENLSLKVSGGGTLTLMGLSMRYSERLVLDEDTQSAEISDAGGTQTNTFAGYFGSVDAEWWLNGRTALFASAYYESLSETVDLELDTREAQVEVETGLGLRIGISTRF